MQFCFTVVERILAQPEQLLDSQNDDSIIKIRLAQAPKRQLLVHSKQKINERMLKKCLNKQQLNNVDVQKYGNVTEEGHQQFLITLDNSEGEISHIISSNN